MDRRPQYAVVHVNTGAETLDNVVVKYGTFESLCGVLVPNAEKAQGGVKATVPERLTVVWTTPDGKPHEKAVTVEGSRPFSELVVTISGDVVTAVLR